ncbi:hypothetical protein ACVWZ6_002506 [Bradyrhizobium sp. GM6.1]
MMAQKIIASQFTYASRSIATLERPVALAHAFAKVIDQASIAVHPAPIAVPMTDHSASRPPPLRSNCAKKVDALAVALMKPRISGRAAPKPQG